MVDILPQTFDSANSVTCIVCCLWCPGEFDSAISVSLSDGCVVSANSDDLSDSAQDVSQLLGLTAPANRHCLGTGRVVKCRKGFCLDSDLLAYGLYCLCRLPYTSFLL